MDIKTLSCDLISKSIQENYCPRQFFYTMPEFKKSPFFTGYCANVPCRGDIECNRAACWNMLSSPAPYVQDSAVNVAQVVKCPAEFFGVLSDFEHMRGSSAQQLFRQFYNDFGSTEFCKADCPLGFSLNCVARKLESASGMHECWSKLLAELKAHVK